MKSLAVKYRPSKVKDIIGQDQNKKILSQIIETRKVPPAILYSGGTGLGKTSSARLLARTINCEEGIGCGKCESCKLFDSSPDGHNDYMEINAASERGIDKIRELATLASYAPMFRHRFIVVDECHALTGQAANALLKPLEEPHSHLTWILATTNPEKLLKPIINRCIHIPVSPVPSEALAKRLKYIAKKEEYKLSGKYASRIAEYSGGYVRDAISVLESLIRSGKTKNLNKAIESAFSNSSEMQIVNAAAGVLIGIYEETNSIVVESLAAVDDFVQLTNKMTYMNAHLMYHCLNLMGQKVANPYFKNWETKQLLDALADSLTKKNRAKVFQRTIDATSLIEDLRQKLFGQSVLDTRSAAIATFCK